MFLQEVIVSKITKNDPGKTLHKYDGNANNVEEGHRKAVGSMLGISFVLIVDDRCEKTLGPYFVHGMARKAAVMMMMMDGSYHTCAIAILKCDTDR
jgi:hypothetical protein